MATAAMQVESYINRLKRGKIFTFSQVVNKVKAAKDTICHALKKLEQQKLILTVKKGVYLKPVMTRFGPLLASPGEVIKVIAKEKQAEIFPAGASLTNAFGISTQLPMGNAYITNKRIKSFSMNNAQVELRYSRAFENAVKKLARLPMAEKQLLLKLWVILDYIGPTEASQAKAKLASFWHKLSPKAKEKFTQICKGKLHWVKNTIPMMT